MRIAHLLLTHSFAGTERHVVELANAQALAGHDVTVILHKRAAENRPNAIAHRFNEQVKKVFVGGPGFFAFWFARRRVKNLTLDVAHGHLSGGCRALKGLAGKFLRVATLHIRYKPQQHRDMDALIAIAPWQLEDIPTTQKASTQQINNWTQPVKLDPLARQKIRAELGISDSDYLVGALCRTEASKGLDILIEAFVANQPLNCRLAIVGGGRNWQDLRDQAPQEVIMPGFVDRPQDWMCAFDAFVSSARSEPFGLVFLEAFAAGLPVLATASEGAQMFQSLINRPLLKCGDVADLAKGLKKFVEERPAKRIYELSEFDYALQVKKVEDFYKTQLSLASQKH